MGFIPHTKSKGKCCTPGSFRIFLFSEPIHGDNDLINYICDQQFNVDIY